MFRSLSLARLLIPAEAICLTCLVGAVASHRRHRRQAEPPPDDTGSSVRAMPRASLGAASADGSAAGDRAGALRRLGTALAAIEAAAEIAESAEGAGVVIGREVIRLGHFAEGEGPGEGEEGIGISGVAGIQGIDIEDDTTYDDEWEWRMEAVRRYNQELRARTQHEFGFAFGPDGLGPGAGATAQAGLRTLRGRTVAFDGGAPIVGARVAFVSGGRRAEATTDVDGAFALRGVAAGAPGRLLVRADSDLYVEDTRDITLDPGVVRPEGRADDITVPPVRLVRRDRRPDSSRAGAGLAAVNRDGRAVVAYVTPSSPAAAARIRAGDWLLAIDGADASDIGTSALGVLLRGAPASDVDLTLAPAAGGEPRTVRLTRSMPGR